MHMKFRCSVSGTSAACRPRRLPPTATTVVGVDVNAGQGRGLNDGRSPIVEPGLDELLAAARRERAAARDDRAPPKRCATPSCRCSASARRAGKNGSLDLTYLERVAEQIGEALARQGRLPRRRRPQHGAAGHDARRRHSGARADVGQEVRRRASASSVNPEFLREGTALKDFRQPPLTLVGHNHAADASRHDGALRRRSTRRWSAPASASRR